MRIAIITRDLPLPPGTGLNLVIHNLVRGLADFHEVRFFILHKGYYGYQIPPGESGNSNSFPWPFEEFEPGGSPNNEGDNKLSRATRYYGVTTERLAWLSQRLTDFGAARIVGFDYNLAPYLALLTNRVPKILNAVDSEILYYKNQILAGNCKSSVLKHFGAAWLMGREHLRNCDALVTVSPADSQNIERYCGVSKVHTIPNGVDHEFFAPNPALEPQGNRVVFCGSLSFEPNRQAITWFVESCWDQIRALRPDAKLLVIGKNPTQHLARQLESKAGVECLGFVDDIRKYILESAVSVAPMITGSGIKNKILEAWALGVAVVATDVAVRGLTCMTEQNILVSNSPSGLSQQIVRLLNDSALRHRIGLAGRNQILSHYTWDRQQRAFAALVNNPELALRPNG